MTTALTRLALLALILPLPDVRVSAETGEWMFLPGSRHSLALLANPEEPRTGVRFEPGTSNLKLDVGTGVELLEFAPSGEDRLLLGVDIFAYALTTNNSGLRLQVDALDGFFGGHVLYSRRMDQATIHARLRILHRSAHFVDGHIDPATGYWAGNRDPVPYTRDFGELAGVLDLSTAVGMVRVYSGISYATLIRPTMIERVGGLIGGEFRTSDSTYTLFGKPFNLFTAYNLTLAGIPAYLETHTLETGIRFGSWSSTGVMILASYHHGPEIYGQYYDLKRDYWQIGFSFDIR